MKIAKRIYATVDSHTFSLFAMRVKNEGLTMDKVLTALVKLYNNGDLTDKKVTDKARDRFSYLMEEHK